jgi:hypothetical protein
MSRQTSIREPQAPYSHRLSRDSHQNPVFWLRQVICPFGHSPASDLGYRSIAGFPGWVYRIAGQEVRAMKVQVAKWGNSTAVRLPKTIVKQLGLAHRA